MKRLITKVLTVLITVSLICTGSNFETLAKTRKPVKKISVTKVTITKPSNKSLVLKKGKTYTLKTKVIPSNATNKKLSFSSSNNKVARVTKNGKITAVKNGKTTIYVKATDGSKKVAKLEVRVGVPVTKVNLNKTNLTVTAEEKVQLKATVTPKKATMKTVKWTTSNSKIATVDSKGLVTTKAKGKVTITATAVDGSNKKASCVIVVKEIKPNKITLNTTSLTLKEKESYSLQASVLPTNAKDKTITWTSDNENVATVDASGNVRAISQGNATITATANGNGSVKASCQVSVTKEIIIIPDQGNNNGGNNNGGNNNPVESDSDYKLVWSDDFSGDSLDMTNWNMELREPGWVNNELQRYTNSPDNIYVRDGKLVLKANKIESEGVTSYTSGKVTTQSKQIFKYGKFEIKAKVPSGQGLWPAIWMMPEDENLYGQWPKCGEIDIMEILGNEPNKMYGTLHYGVPHSSQQGTYILNNGTFADDYHIYAVEWEPSEIRFYIDGHLYHTVNDWFTKVEGQGELTFPAPFDQPFFLQLNLAVGGSWPGNPDDTTDFENAKLEVDYVKVYQKESYDENVEKPIKEEVILRDPDATGNYIVNGDFNIAEDLSDSSDWYLLTALGGKATANIAQNKLVIDSTDVGTANYSVQFVQPNLPMKKGGNYRLSFDAKASENRTMIINVTAPDRNYIRYMPDTEVALTTEQKSYSYDFTMTGDNDANGRVEYNLGNQGSLASVEISNVRLVKVSETTIEENDTKTILPDGNYVYNGAFQEGTNRLGYWDILNNVLGANVSVTNINNVRELKAEVPSTVTNISDVIVKQTKLGISPNKSYVLSFDAYGMEAKTIQVKINGETFDASLNTTRNTFKYQFSSSDVITSADLEFLIGVAGTTYIDNVKMIEDGNLVNGDFSSMFAGWEVFVDSGISSKVTYVVDGLTENNAAEFTISDTSEEGWKIQLKQNNVTLEQGKWYKLTLDAKSSIARKLMFALQKDGSIDNDWTPYSGEMIVDLDSDYKTYEIIFKMKNITDAKTILSISMGGVSGIHITDVHKVWIDNVKLEETTEPEIIINPGENLIKNGDFSLGMDDWNAAISGGEATYSFINNKAVFDITDVGSEDWHIQLKQSGLVFEQDKTYQVKMKITSSVDRTVKMSYMSTSYDWYGGADIQLLAGETKEIDTTFMMSKPTDQAADFVLSMGYMENLAVNPGEITIEDVSITEVIN